MIEKCPSVNILGMTIPAIMKEGILSEIICRIESKKKSYICLPNVYSAVQFQKDSEFRNAILSADFLVADGLPLVWFSSLKGKRIGRIRGSDLMLALCQLSHRYSLSHFFYGGGPKIAEKLSIKLGNMFPGLNVVGTHSPPPRPVGHREDDAIIASINRARPDILWVGLGSPKQEIWMYEHRERLEIPMMIGVGAAFDFLSGNKKPAPKWMQNTGFEWLFRLIQEPRRLWRRYILCNTEFLILVLLDLFQTQNRSSTQ